MTAHLEASINRALTLASVLERVLHGDPALWKIEAMGRSVVAHARVENDGVTISADIPIEGDMDGQVDWTVMLDGSVVYASSAQVGLRRGDTLSLSWGVAIPSVAAA